MIASIRSSRFRKTATLSLFSFLAAASSLANAEAPKIFWHSQPVRPNETVMVQGHAITSETMVDILRLRDAFPGSPLPATAAAFPSSPRRIKPVSFGESIVNFVIPKPWANGVYAYRLTNDVQSQVHLINAPEPWFIHGDRGSRATPGGWVAVYGNSLAKVGGTTRLAFAKNGTVMLQIDARPTGGNAYAQYFDIPPYFSPDSYELYVHNGFGGPAAWARFVGNEAADTHLLKIVSPNDLWETAARQNEIIVDAANGLGSASSWDEVFANAIATVKAFRKPGTNIPSGGVIRVRPGVYTLEKRFVLPDKTIFAGTNKDTTILQWGESSVLERLVGTR